MPRTTTRAAAEGVSIGTSDILNAIDLLGRAISLNSLIMMAAEGMAVSDIKSGIATGCDLLDGILEEMNCVLYGALGRSPPEQIRK